MMSSANMAMVPESSKPTPISNANRSINFSGNSISMSECKQLYKHIASSETLEEIRFTDCLLSEETAKCIINAIALNKSLKIADFRGNNIRNNGAEHLCKLMKQNTTIRELFLEWNALGLYDTSMAAIAEGVAGNNSLEVLDLSNNQICHAGGKLLGLALKRNKTLRVLDMRWNNIGVGGGRDILSALQYNKHLLNLQLSGNNIPSDTLKAIETAIQRNIDQHSLFEQHVTMMQSLKEEIHHIEHEKRLEVSTLATELEKEKEQHEYFTVKTHSVLEELKSTVDSLSSEKESICKEKSLKESELKKTNEKIYQLEDRISDLNRTNTELQETRYSEIKNLKGEISNERKQWQIEKLSNDSRIAALQKERELLQGQIDNNLVEISNLKNSIKTKEDDQICEDQKSQREKDRLRREYENHVKTLTEKITRHINDKEQLEEEVIRLKSSIMDNKVKHDEEALSQRTRLKQDETFKCKQYEEKIDMLVASKEELQSKVNKLFIDGTEKQSRLVTHLKDIENYKQLLAQHQESSVKRENETRNEMNKLRNEIDNEKRECRNLRNKVDDLEKKNIDLQTEMKEVRVAKDGEIGMRENEIFSLKESVKSKEDEIRRMHQDEITRSNMLESALQTYILSARQTKHYS